MFEIMSLPPVEEVARKAQDGKINEKKLKRLRSFGEGSKREWWVQNMKGEVRKQRSVSSEAAVRTLMEVNGNGEKGEKERDWKKQKTVMPGGSKQRFVSSEGVVRMPVARVKDIETKVGEENVEASRKIQNEKEGEMEKDLKKCKVESMMGGNVETLIEQCNTHKDTFFKTTKKLDDQPFELRIEELDTIERLHVMMDPSGCDGEAHAQSSGASEQIKQIEKEDDKIQTKSTGKVEYIGHENERVESALSQAEFIPPDQWMMASCLFCILLALAILTLLISFLFVAPLGSWFQLEEEETCPCSCPSD